MRPLHISDSRMTDVTVRVPSMLLWRVILAAQSWAHNRRDDPLTDDVQQLADLLRAAEQEQG